MPLLRRRVSGGLPAVLGTPDLFATAYGNVGSSIYYALGVTAIYALGMTPITFAISGLIFAFTAATYAEATARFPEAGGSASFARHAFNELVSFFAAWAQMLNYTVTIAISSYTVPPYLSVLPGLHALHSGKGPARVRGGALHRARGAQHPRHPGVGEAQRLPRAGRPRDAGAARDRRSGADPLALGARLEHPLRQRPDAQLVPDLDPHRHGRLHRHRDDLEHGRGGARPGPRRAALDRARGARRLRHLRVPAGGRAVRDARAPRALRRPEHGLALHVAARLRVRVRSGGRHRPEPRARAADDARRLLRRRARGHDPDHRDERRHHRRLAPDLLDGPAPPVPEHPAHGASEVPDAVGRDPDLHARGDRADDPRLAVGPEGHRVPRQPVRVRRDALVHDRARGGDRAAPETSGPRPAVPRAAQPARRAATTCRCSRSSEGSAR